MEQKDQLFDLPKILPLFSDERKDLLFLARTAQSAERFEDMVVICKALVRAAGNTPLTADERDVVAVSFKNVVCAMRAAWRTLEETHEDKRKESILAEYRAQVERGIQDVCRSHLEVLEGAQKQGGLIKSNQNKPDSHVFFIKMAGDHYRYLAEVTKNRKHTDDAMAWYKVAMDTAAQNLAPTHPVRLGTALNYSVCLMELLRDKQEACRQAKMAFDQAISKLDSLEEADYKDSTLIMQLLRDNLSLWTGADAPQQ